MLHSAKNADCQTFDELRNKFRYEHSIEPINLHFLSVVAQHTIEYVKTFLKSILFVLDPYACRNKL